MIETGYKNNCAGAVLLCVDGFVDKAGMRRRSERAFGIHFLWLMAYYDNNTVPGIDAVIVVVVQLGSGDSITSENQGCLDIGRTRERNRDKVISELQSGSIQLNRGLRSDLRARRDLKVLKVAVVVAHRPQSPETELGGDVIRGFVEFGRPISTTFQLITGEIFHMLQIPGSGQIPNGIRCARSSRYGADK